MAEAQCQYKSWDGTRVCSEPMWQGSTEGFCIFHDPSKEKNPTLFRKKLERKLKSEEYDFRGYYFPESVELSDHIFARDADFEEAIFSSSANFSNATFSGRVNFAGATFFDRASFLNTSFTGGAYFAGASFFGGGNFVGSSFTGGAYFAGATFFGGAYFSGSTFSGGAHFARSSFSGGAYFSGATFVDRAGFSKAAFSEEAEFMGATFSGDAHFLGAVFHKWARFEEARFADVTDFVNAEFLGDTSFWKTKFEKSVDFQKAVFARNVSFLDTQFIGEMNFKGSRFEKNMGEDPMSSALLERSYRNVKNALLQKGIYDSSDEFRYREMEARRAQMRRMERVMMEIYRFLGYGGKPERVILISGFIMAVSAVIYLFNGITINTTPPIDYSLLAVRPSWQLLRDFLECLYYSAVSFIPLGQNAMAPSGYISKATAIVEGFSGIFLVFLFAVIAARKIIR